jgi:hypothetical protein
LRDGQHQPVRQSERGREIRPAFSAALQVLGDLTGGLRRKRTQDVQLAQLFLNF